MLDRGSPGSYGQFPGYEQGIPAVSQSLGRRGKSGQEDGRGQEGGDAMRTGVIGLAARPGVVR
jgi:hypothetical protein